MSVDVNERIAAVATIATDGEIEILRRDPFAAKLQGPGCPIMMQTFIFEPAAITVVELVLPVAQIAESTQVDRWIARVAPRLFNVHVAAREIDSCTYVEARSSLVADDLTVTILGQSIMLLAVGAEAIAQELQSFAVPSSPSENVSAEPQLNAAPDPQVIPEDRPAVPARVAFAGYL